MKLNNINILVSNMENKTNKEGNPYTMLSFMTLDDGSNFSIIEKNLEIIEKLEPMKKYNVNMDLTSNKYGLKLDIASVNKDLGSILG